MNKGNIFASNSSKTVFTGAMVVMGYMFNKAISFLMIPILTRLLSTDDYGKVSIYAAWVAILAYIIGMALEYSVRNAFVDYKEDMDAYMSSLCGLSVVGGMTIGIVAFTVNKYVAHQMSDMMMVCCIIHAYVHSLVNYFSMKFTMYQQFTKRVLILVLPNLLSSVFGVFLIVSMTNARFMGRIWGYLLVFAPLGFFLLVTQFQRGKTFFRAEYWKYALIISFPMVFHGLSNVILTNFDRILISSIRGDSEAGIYSFIYNFSMITIAITTAIENLWIPWFTKEMEKQNEIAINRYVKIYIYVAVFMICGVLMIAPEIMMLMSSPEYWGGKIIIVPIVLSSFMIFLYSLHVAVEIYYKSNKYIALNTFIAAVFNIVTDVLLIPRFGMMGAAFTTLVSYVLSFLMHYWYSHKLNSKLYPFKTYILPLIIVFGLSVYSYAFLDIWFARWIIAVILGVIALAALKNKDNIIAHI